MNCYNQKCKYHEIDMPEQRPHTAFCSDECKAVYNNGLEPRTSLPSRRLTIPEIQEKLREMARQRRGELF